MAAFPVLAFADDSQAPPGFLERHWMQALILFLFVATVMAHIEENRVVAASWWTVFTLIYLAYCFFNS